MILSCLKTFSLFFLLTIIAQFSFAQSNYYKYSIGFGGGINQSYTDVYKGSTGNTLYGVVDYYMSPYVTLGLEGQYGLIQGGDIMQDPYNRQFVNKYSSITLNARAMLGEFVEYERRGLLHDLRGLYIGIGLGMINNNITDIVRERPSWSNDPGYIFPGKDKSKNMLVPINLGFNYFISDRYDYHRFIININAQANYTFGEGLDGYDDQNNKFKNYAEDVYVAYTIGFRYMFGTMKVHYKTL